jgi:hypothetical protein
MFKFVDMHTSTNIQLTNKHEMLMCFSTRAKNVERKQSSESEQNDGMIPLNCNQCNVYFNVQCLINALLTVHNTFML